MSGFTGVPSNERCCTPARLLDVIRNFAAGPVLGPVAVAATVRAKRHDKYYRYLSENLLDLGYAARALDVPGAWQFHIELADGRRPSAREPELTLRPAHSEPGSGWFPVGR
ncbi:hypothetical protein DMB66_53725 [Actinoplanes sp. ATCC 53533]|uniref:hypothetical protein n=1 Tax=Actinoplanes sp. ATCC 53533 TaxID=1288362 RepID=UPI000F77ACE2|nr:hypothetical protein [Actinoplanes sp. ATCC 53533]RSM43110.1 hypothetical protein DMB66_53725 [Actinoplanes sp. ATCC 53533]